MIDLEKRAATAKRYRELNRDKRNAQKREWYKKHAESERAARRQYYQQNAEQCREYGREYHKNNTEARLISMKQWKEKNKEHVEAYSQSYYQKNRDRLLAAANSRPNKKRLEQERGRAIKMEFIREYGGCCACCGEATPLFLTLDHINGREDRKFRGWRGYKELKRLGWPKAGLRILCFNCNSGRQLNGGICPHQQAVLVAL